MTDSNNNNSNSNSNSNSNIDGFAILMDAVATMGGKVVERTRLAYGANVRDAFRGITSNGLVIVATTDAGFKMREKLAAAVDSKSAGASKNIVLVDARETGKSKNGHARVLSNVRTFGKSRELNWNVQTWADADDVKSAVIVRKSA